MLYISFIVSQSVSHVRHFIPIVPVLLITCTASNRGGVGYGRFGWIWLVVAKISRCIDALGNLWIIDNQIVCLSFVQLQPPISISLGTSSILAQDDMNRTDTKLHTAREELTELTTMMQHLQSDLENFDDQSKNSLRKAFDDTFMPGELCGALFF